MRDPRTRGLRRAACLAFSVHPLNGSVDPLTASRRGDTIAVLAGIPARGTTMRKALVLVAVAAAAFAAASVAAPSAGAYGNTAEFQVAVSLNCDAKTQPFCTSVVGLGGEWAWFAFNNDGTFDATLTFCSHEGFNGAFHQNIDGIWKTGTPVDFPIWGQTSDFFVSGDNRATWQATDVPAAAGPYSFNPAPGIPAAPHAPPI